MNFSELEAGQALDMLVAEQVLGWKRGQKFANGNGSWLMANKSLTWNQTPRFSTDIAAAWQVVEEMINQHDASCFTVETLIPNSDPVVYFVTFGFTDDEKGDAFELPLAICRAALKALNGAPDLK